MPKYTAFHFLAGGEHVQSIETVAVSRPSKPLKTTVFELFILTLTSKWNTYYLQQKSTPFFDEQSIKMFSLKSLLVLASIVALSVASPMLRATGNSTTCDFIMTPTLDLGVDGLQGSINYGQSSTPVPTTMGGRSY